MVAGKAIDLGFLEALPGYVARRAAVRIFVEYARTMGSFELRPAEFAALVLIGHNPGVTARQLGTELAIAPPNLVKFLRRFEERDWIERNPHPTDRRARGLRLTAAGAALLKRAEPAALASDRTATAALSDAELATLLDLLRRVYKG